MRFYVYLYRAADMTPLYIGKGTGDRLSVHARRPCNRRLFNRIRKDAALSSPVICEKIASGLTEEEAHRLERDLIALLGRADLGTGSLYNLTAGGEGCSGRVGIKYSAASIEKMRASQTGRTLSAETRARMSAARIGKSRSEATRAKISAAVAGREFGQVTLEKMRQAKLGKAPINKGKSMSDAQREKLRAAWVIRKSKGVA